MKANDVMDIVKSAVRPFLAITGWALFLYIIYLLVTWFIGKLNNVTIESIAVVAIFAGLVGTFSTAIVSIVNQWLGSRTTQTRVSTPPEAKPPAPPSPTPAP